MSESNWPNENPSKREANNLTSDTSGQNTAAKRTSKLAVASIICLLLAMVSVLLFLEGYSFFFTVACGLFPAALGLGLFACITIMCKKHLHGYIYTILPITFGGVFVLLMAQAQVTLKMRSYYERINTAKYNLRLLGETIHNYAEDHDGYLPAANKWCDLLMGYNKELSKDNFKHPKIEENTIAFNENLDGLHLSDVPDNLILLFEANGNWNVAGGPELLKKELTSRKIVDILLINGKIETYWIKHGGVKVNGGTFKPPRWKP